MNYYYLTQTDIIQQDDEWNSFQDDLGWWICTSSVGKTIQCYLINYPNTKVRRKIKTTKLGNVL